MRAKYIHTNLIARDWQILSLFYQTVFGCVPVPPQRDIKGEVLERGTGVTDAHLTGEHLRLPGFDETGPTLEVFQYNILAAREQTAVNQPGFGHLAFLVDDVAAAKREVVANGGKEVGMIVQTQPSPQITLTWCYVTDPEGNILELQSVQYQ